MQVVIGGWRGPGWQVTDADPGQGRRVREWITSAVARHGCPVDLDDVALAVAELFGNAVTHGPAGGRALAGYCLWRDGAPIVGCDRGGAAPPPVAHGPDPAGGGRRPSGVDSLAAPCGSFWR